MKAIETKDKSMTFYNKQYAETYHSTSGAIEESFKKFVEPCMIKEGMIVLDICFGLGYNVLAAMTAAKNLKIISLEKDKTVMREMQGLEVPEKLKEKYEIVKKAAKEFAYKDNDYEIKIILGDATQSIKILNERFDAVFLDPFSPPKNPELWTEEFFMDIKKVMKPGAILATYSCAGVVRRNLTRAGFEVKDGPIVGRRSPGTIATVLSDSSL